jgi:hypothetical protein
MFYKSLVLASFIAVSVFQARASLIDPQGPDYLDIGVDNLYLSAPGGICFTEGSHTDCLEDLRLTATGSVVDSYASGPELDSFTGDLSGIWEDPTDSISSPFDLIGPIILEDDRTASNDWLVPYDSQMMEMDLSATGPLDSILGDTVELRVDPSQPTTTCAGNTGCTTITPTSGPMFQITSFFDVFTDLSLDGGSTWTPASPTSTEFDLVAPEPGTAGLALLMFAAGAAMRRPRRA